MYNLLLVIHYISIFGLLVESIFIFHKWRNSLHGLLFLSCISTLVSNAGYLMQISSHTEEAYINALKLSYLGRVWIPLSLFLFAMQLCHIKVPDATKAVLCGAHILTYILVLTCKSNGLYYTNLHFTTEGLVPKLEHGNGIWHSTYMTLVCIYGFIGIFVLIRAYIKTKRKNARKRFVMVLLSIFSQLTSFILYLVHAFGDYDATAFGFVIGMVFMYIALFKYDLLDSSQLAKDFLVDELAEAIIAVDNYGRVSYYNYPAKSLFPEIVTEPEKVIEKVRYAVGQNKNLEINERILTPDSNILYQEGEKVGELFVMADDTEHFRYMDQLKEQKRIADEANQAKSSFLANMSHEIRTPINAVIGMDEMILRESREKQTVSYANDIMSASRTLLSLINDILDFSKVEEGRLEIIPTQYELGSLINDLVNMIRERASKKGIAFNVNVDKEIPHLLYGDEIRLKQCAMNVLTNAVKYTEKGSVDFTVSFERGTGDIIALIFTVKDTGIGMKEEDLDKLFSPFTRMEEKRNRGIEGTGLGMSITRQLLDLMGSKLDVKSVYGEGSKFSFRVNQQAMTEEPIGDYSERFMAENVRIKGYRELFHAPDACILVVDDTEMNLAVIKSLLKKTKIKIDTAESGREAISRAMIKKYDLAFIDHMMPEMDGIETLAEMKKIEDRDDTVYVALTANAVSGARQMYLDAGFADYLPKPIDGAKLEKLILKYLPEDKIITDYEEDEESSSEFVSNKVLIIDDDETARAAAEEILKGDYVIFMAESGTEGLKIAGEENPDIILLDINLTDMSGFDVLKELKGNDALSDVPVMIMTGDGDYETEVSGFLSGASDFVRKPLRPQVVRERVRRLVDLYHYNQSIEGEVSRQAERSRSLSREMMLSLAKTVDTKDHYTNGHSRRVAAYAAEIARRLGKTPDEQEKIYEIGLLHDIGKIGIHEDIIHKDSRLTDDEYAEIKEHTLKGYEILKEITMMPELADGARSHHESYDGKGYPDGLKGEEIPETARIVCVADCYDAMTSTRTYSKPREQADVRAEIERCMGTRFDPLPAKAMLQMIDEDPEYKLNENATGSMIWKGYSRLWDLKAKDAPTVHEENAIPSFLHEVEGLEIEEGVKNCGTPDGFMSVITVFHDTASAKSAEIRKLYEDKDWENYTIKVHALKSSARIIGAAKLSELAKNLEDAGKERNIALIDEKTDDLLSMYDGLDASLKKLDKAGDTLPEISIGMLSEAYQTMEEIAMAMDYGMMDDLLKDLSGYHLQPDDAARIGEIKNMLLALDWDGIMRKIKDR
ncbi:MAG: response regulator [Lachnospiraceae bacterium]|nr:response regulator [Lachnospiraceae bacterium]